MRAEQAGLMERAHDVLNSAIAVRGQEYGQNLSDVGMAMFLMAQCVDLAEGASPLADAALELCAQRMFDLLCKFASLEGDDVRALMRAALSDRDDMAAAMGLTK